MFESLSWRQRVIAAALLGAMVVVLAMWPSGSSAASSHAPRAAAARPVRLPLEDSYLSAVRTAQSRRLLASSARVQRDTAPPAAVPSPAPSAPAPATPVYAAGPMSAAQIGQAWLAAGGSPWAEQTAICIADHESGGNPGAISPTNDYGLWQINGSNNGLVISGVPGLGTVTVIVSLSVPVNARDAVALSRNGTDWSPWTTAGMCGA